LVILDIGVHKLPNTVNRVLMKLFRTSNIETEQDCRMFFKIKLPSEILTLRYNKFISNQHAFASLHKLMAPCVLLVCCAWTFVYFT